MQKSVVIAGGAGFIGSHLVDRVLGRNDVERVVVVDNLWTGRRENLAHIHDDRLHVVEGDVEDFASDIAFDEAYHLASPASPPWYMQEPARVIRANVMGAFRLRALLKPGGRLCYTSTSEVYGDPLVSPQPESYRGSVDCTGPRSSYDESKRCTEAFLFESARTEGLDARVVRLFNVYGPRTRPDDGRAVSNFITQALTGRPMTVHGDGAQSRSWGYIEDIVEGLARFFWRDDTDYRGPLNIGNDREVPVIEVAELVRRLVPGSRIAFAPRPPQDPSNRRPDLTLARRVLPGWTCGVAYEDGVRRTLDWFAADLAQAPAPRARRDRAARPSPRVA
ncbi:MAG: NAD-dependent epimerase/dehydratase family protein, partial [Azospirillaceae bacterium]